MARFDVRTELRLGQRWVDISGDVYQRDDIEITRGRSDEASRVDPGKCKLTINNRGGTYSPRNPTGPYYGQLGRNTPIRVRIGDPPTASWRWSTFDAVDQVAVSTHLYGDSGLLVCVWITNFTPGDYTVPASMTLDAETDAEGSTMATAREVLTSSGETGDRTATFSDEDTQGHATSAIAVPGDGSPPTVEEFWDDHRYASDVTFVTGQDTQVGWLLVAVQGWQYDYNDSMPTAPGGTPGAWTLLAASERADNTVARVKVWSRFVVTAGPQKVVFPTAGDGNRNNHARLYLLSSAAFSAMRFSGEVSAWPPRWDASDTDVYVPIEAAGILRRLGQGQAPIRSTAYREILSEDYVANVVAYWPCEDSEGASQIASALSGGQAMTITGVANLADSDAFAASASLPTMATSTFSAPVPDYENTGQTQLSWLMRIDDEEPTDGAPVVELRTSGSAARWLLRYETGDDTRLLVYNASGTEIYNQGVIWSVPLLGNPMRATLEITETSGGDVDYVVSLLPVGAESARVFRDTIPGHTAGKAQRVTVTPNMAGGDIGDTAFGHVAVENTISTTFSLGAALNAWRGEPAGRRVERLLREERVVFTPVGDLDDTEPMGPQGVSNLLDLLQEAAKTDGGILHETRREVGLTYRPRRSLYNQGLS